MQIMASVEHITIAAPQSMAVGDFYAGRDVDPFTDPDRYVWAS